ncbi:MAG: hypothetical protein DLM50_09325 [Candidatus Meridianibacter frigidus]|nr:MAG: hypothetical protein DLM50_09325 [Candidatus Eremiobacteraeota bacterium]
MAIRLVLLIVSLALAGTGCGKKTSATRPADDSGVSTSRGATIFAANCQTCHGANGAGGGIGPSLRNERGRKNLAQTIAWIKNPEPPMPKLFPGTLNDKDVSNVATYVQSL